MPSVRVVSGLVFLLLTGAGSRNQQAFKGYELYSWQEGSEWRFALLIGTNRDELTFFVLGDAQVSTMHCNFLINAGNATAADIEGLGEEVRRRVHAATGVTLEWEIHRIGVPTRRPEAVQ